MGNLTTMYPLFAQAIESHFPGAIPLDTYCQKTYHSLESYGFDKDNTFGMVSVCRDEIAQGLLDVVVKYWGKTFDCRSLGGFVLMGKTGVITALNHVPLLDGVGRFVFYAMPHIAISADGEIGVVEREGISQHSHACGSLMAVLHELNSGRVNLMTDLDDIEQCTVRQKLLSAVHLGQPIDQIALTHVASQIIQEDLRRLLKVVDPKVYAYGVFTGIMIHGPDEQDWVYPLSSCCISASLPDGLVEIDCLGK